jgi:hypothetical protein
VDGSRRLWPRGSGLTKGCTSLAEDVEPEGRPKINAIPKESFQVSKAQTKDRL